MYSVEKCVPTQRTQRPGWRPSVLHLSSIASILSLSLSLGPSCSINQPEADSKTGRASSLIPISENKKVDERSRAVEGPAAYPRRRMRIFFNGWLPVICHTLGCVATTSVMYVLYLVWQIAALARALDCPPNPTPYLASICLIQIDDAKLCARHLRDVRREEVHRCLPAYLPRYAVCKSGCQRREPRKAVRYLPMYVHASTSGPSPSPRAPERGNSSLPRGAAATKHPISAAPADRIRWWWGGDQGRSTMVWRYCRATLDIGLQSE